MYNVDYNNYEYRDPHHPYTYLFVDPAALQSGMMPGMMQPGMTQAPTPASVSPLSQPTLSPATPSGAQLLPMAGETGGGGAGEESYIENILRFNRGQIGTFYMTFENNTQWNARVFRGRVETAGRDHIIISDPQTGKRYLLLMVNLDWVEFDQPLLYVPPTVPANVQLTTGGANGAPGLAASGGGSGAPRAE